MKIDYEYQLFPCRDGYIALSWPAENNKIKNSFAEEFLGWFDGKDSTHLFSVESMYRYSTSTCATEKYQPFNTVLKNTTLRKQIYENFLSYSAPLIERIRASYICMSCRSYQPNTHCEK